MVSIQAPIPPHAVGVEKAVLSVLMKDPTKLDEAPQLSGEYFHASGLRKLFEQIAETVLEGGSLDLTLFVQRLHDKALLEDVGGPSAVTEVFTYAPTSAHFKGHVRELAAKCSLRRALSLAGEIESAIAEGKDPGEVAELVATRSTAITDALEETRRQSDTKALLRAAAQRWEELAAGRVDPMGVQTSLVEINQRFRGLKPGRVTVISGLPSEGKSLLGGQLFMDAVSSGAHGLFLTWEMGEDELIDRFLAYEARLPIDAMVEPLKFSREVLELSKPDNHTIQEVRGSFRKLAGYNVTVRAMHGQNIAQAAAAIRREHRKSPLGIVAIDFIQRVGAARHMEKQPYERQLTDIADRFQNLAQELGFHGLMLSQLNKDGGAKHAEAINESCALHLKIVNTPKMAKDGTPETDEEGNAVIKRRGLGVVKDRFHGNTGKLLDIALNRATQRFERFERQ